MVSWPSHFYNGNPYAQERVTILRRGSGIWWPTWSQHQAPDDLLGVSTRHLMTYLESAPATWWPTWRLHQAPIDLLTATIKDMVTGTVNIQDEGDGKVCLKIKTFSR